MSHSSGGIDEQILVQMREQKLRGVPAIEILRYLYERDMRGLNLYKAFRYAFDKPSSLLTHVAYWEPDRPTMPDRYLSDTELNALLEELIARSPFGQTHLQR
jgi:hypothetical protein